MPKNNPKVGTLTNDELELVTVRNITHVLEDVPVPNAVSAVLRVLQSMIVGVSPDRDTAIKNFDNALRELRLTTKDIADKDFGFMLPESDGPISADGPEGGNNVQT